MKTGTNPLSFFTIVLLIAGLASCTEAYKKKQAVAHEYVDDMKAESVIVGYAAKASAGSETTKITTLTFHDVEGGDAMALEYRTNKVAVDYFNQVGEVEMKDETHLEIVAEMKDGATYNFLFPLKDLRNIESYLTIADAMVNACHEADTAKITELKDNSYLPDEEMGMIWNINAYNDSVYHNQPFSIKQIGYRITTGEEDESLEMLSVDYECGNNENVTYYTVNVDRKTRKVVYLWMKTDPR